MSEQYRIIPLGTHERANFTCGIESLDRYLKTQATQDMRRNVSNCFVAVDSNDSIVAYYTFAAANIISSEIPDEMKKLPRYPQLPAALIGRLAVHQRFQRQHLGEALIADAALRAQQSAPAVFALLVDAKSEAAEAFYKHLGFRSLLSRSSSLFLPVATANKAWLLK